MSKRRGDNERSGDETERLEQFNPAETLVRGSIADAPTRGRRTLGAFTRSRISAQATAAAPTAPQPDETVVKGRALQKVPSETTRALIADSSASAEKPLVIDGARKPRRPALYVIPRRTGPRSFVAQFMVAMIATAMVAAALTLTTPVGEAASLSAGSPLAALSNSAPWLPTPTNTPTPKPSFLPPAGANPGQQAVIDEIVAVFGDANANNALIVAKCESGYDPNAYNNYAIGSSHAAGVFQILYPSTWDTTSYAADSPFNADANINAAYQIFHRDGNSWHEWQCAKINGIA